MSSIQHSITDYSLHAVYWNPRTYSFYNCNFVPFDQHLSTSSHTTTLTPSPGNHHFTLFYYLFIFLIYLLDSTYDERSYSTCLSSIQLILFTIMSSGFVILSQMAGFSSFYGWIIFHCLYITSLSIHPLIDSYVVSVSWLLWIILQ